MKISRKMVKESEDPKNKVLRKIELTMKKQKNPILQPSI